MNVFLMTTLCLFVCLRLNLVHGNDTPKVLPAEYNLLLSKIAALETRVNAAENKFQTANSDSASVTALQTKVQTLETLVNSLQSQQQSHQSQMNNQQVTISSLISQISSISATMEQKGKIISSLTQDLANEQAKVAALERKVLSLETRTSNDSIVLNDNLAVLSSKTSWNFSDMYSIISSLNTTFENQQVNVLNNKETLELLAVNVTNNRNGLSSLTNEFWNHTNSARKQSTAFNFEVLHLQEEQRDHEAELKSHQSSIDLHNIMLIAQTNRTNEINGRVDNLIRNASDQSQRLMTQGQSITSIQSSLTRVTDIQGKKVIFYTRIPIASITLNTGDTIVFSNVITNEGRGYNRTTGVFTCNIAGTYVFNHNILSVKNNFVVTGFMKNGAIVGFAEGVGSTKWDDTGYNTIALNLQTGDRVWIKVINLLTENQLIDSILSKYITFSDYLYK